MKFRSLLFAHLALTAVASAEVKLSPLFSDHGVLQRDRPIPVWGTAAPGEAVQVKLGRQELQATADSVGNWRVELASMPAGGPYEMKVTGPSNKIAIHDLLVGEVWLASGQSNMEISLAIVRNLPQELAAANHPQLRIFTVARNPVVDPTDTLKGEWVVSTPETAKNFSAVSYFFGSTLLLALHVPVGIVNSSVGNTPAEAWTPFPLLQADPLFSAAATKQLAEMRAAVPPEQMKANLAAWETANDARDTGSTDLKQAMLATDWQSTSLPNTGPAMGLKGAASIWMRKEITLPDRKYDKPANLDLGPMREVDTTYFDGVKVGASATDALPDGHNIAYPVPASLLKPGVHTIVVRVFARQPAGLYMGSKLTNFSVPESGSGKNDAVKIPLWGPWTWRLEHQGAPLSAEAARSEPVLPLRTIMVASALYNGNIHPLRDYAMRGAIWYQGENNADHADAYPTLMTHLITSWREQFNQPHLPFYLVQLPNHGEWSGGWDNMREKQQELVESLPDMGMAVAIDVGESGNIHPHNKRPVGERLAMLALHRVYQENIEDTGPTYTGIKIEGNKIRVELSHASGLKAVGGAIPNFAIAGADRQFYPATAIIEGTSIVVSSPQVAEPVAVRYARSQDPVGCNVYNSADLPMAPFRSDNWDMPKK
ncbi:sialate O-acetylesterase [Granulicella rosea]|uniref:Sialate O-acetylesterase n=1 Tax=Granulicella rosea TaxID=474952 RepID=A0A239LYI6_9BACT|nr:sialate O-acetylesterase [Granulicella rosea]SNT34704.1 sialate O-acetylesterase [Granulicella rosea]